MKSAQFLLTLVSAAVLTACGGGSDGDTLKVGDTYSVMVRDGGELVLDESRLVYAVTTDGTLTQDPNAGNHLPGAFVTLATAVDVDTQGTAAPVIGVEVLEPFLRSLWGELVKHYGVAKPEAVWAQIDDQDQELAIIYLDFKRSGLDIAGYVDFYAVLDQHMVAEFGDNAEQHVLEWLYAADVTQSQLLSVLAAQGQTWDSFVATMVARGDSFQGLQIRWDNRDPADQNFEAYLVNYLSPPPLVTKADPVTEAAKVAVEAAKLKLEIAKFVWQVIKDNRPTIETDTEAGKTSILSIADGNFANYEYAKLGESKLKEIVVCTRIPFTNKCLKDWAKVSFQLSGTYNASNSAAPGHWVPSVSLDVPNVWAFAGQKVNVSAAVSKISNLGGKNDVLPYMEITAEMKVQGNITSDVIRQRFAVHGRDGFSTK